MGNIAIIPARSGSKGLPDKNIIDLKGRPLMAYTIDAAQKSRCFEEVMVSTDSEKYAEVAKSCGAEVPFLRSSVTSGDTAGSWDVVREVLANYADNGRYFDYVALLQPTSPLRDERDIAAAFDMLKDSKINNVISVTEVEHPVQWCFKMPKDHSMREIAKSPYSYMRRQDLEVYYIQNGAIYLVRADKITDASYNIYNDNCYGYIMPKEKSIDIDAGIDLEIAAIMMEKHGAVFHG